MGWLLGSLSVCLSVCLSVSLSLCPSVPLSLCPSVPLSLCPSVSLSLCLSVSLSLCRSVALSLCRSCDCERLCWFARSVCCCCVCVRAHVVLYAALLYQVDGLPPVRHTQSGSLGWY